MALKFARLPDHHILTDYDSRDMLNFNSYVWQIIVIGDLIRHSTISDTALSIRGNKACCHNALRSLRNPLPSVPDSAVASI